jgi:hypothetical protein
MTLSPGGDENQRARKANQRREKQARTASWVHVNFLAAADERINRVFIFHWIKKRRRPRANNVTLEL